MMDMTGYLFNINQDSNFTRHSTHRWILGLGRDLTHSIHTGCEPYQAFYPVGIGAIISAANWLQHETDCSCWTYSEVRNAQIFTLIPIHAFSLVLWFKRNITTDLFSTDIKTRSNGKRMWLLEGIYSLCKFLTQNIICALLLLHSWM